MIDTIITRMRRKIDIIRLDAKARQDVLYHDMDELMSLLDMLERELDAELARVESGLETLHQKMREGEDQ
jgi:K+/H+ antiporter YhaU regulatory subunit KhtT